METTAGVTCSAIASNAEPKSASGLTSCADGRAAGRPCCAHPKRVRSDADANTRPHTNAVTTATPTRARASFDDIVLESGYEGSCSIYRHGKPGEGFPAPGRPIPQKPYFLL